MRTWGGVALALLIVAVPAPSVADGHPVPGRVEIIGAGAAHGFGMAMDGVQGQARAGWSADKILDLFYPGTQDGHAGGHITVGLASASAETVVVPDGGSVVLDGAPAVRLPSGTRLALRRSGPGVTVDGIPAVVNRAAPRHSAPVKAAGDEPPALLPTAPPLLTPTAEPVSKTGPAPTNRPDPSRVVTAVEIRGQGDPALVAVASTGRRYRGTIAVRPHGDGLVVTNRVDLETYVRGIAEEKGQGWPDAGLQALAVAARSLGAATMTWYDKNQANGYNICPSANCQLYLGYDGEEPAMTRAVAATAGRIRTYDGRAILAMYHGNGGGQTESYARMVQGTGADPHPYLTSVRYPFARPSTWERSTSLPEMDGALRGAGIAPPGALERVEVTERGESPRVRRVRLVGASGSTEIAGTRFADALELPSTWFEIGDSVPGAFASGSVFAASGPGAPMTSAATPSPWTAVAVGAGACVLLAVGFVGRRRRALAEIGDTEELERPRREVGEHL